MKDGDDLMAAKRYAVMMLRYASTKATCDRFRRPIKYPNKISEGGSPADPARPSINYATAAFRKLATFEPRRATRKRGPITNIVRFCNPAAGAKMLLAPPTPRDLLDHGATL